MAVSTIPKWTSPPPSNPGRRPGPNAAGLFLLKKHLNSGSMLVGPNNRKKSAEKKEQPKPRAKAKKRGKKGEVEAEEAKPAAAVKCDYSRPIPTPEWMMQARSGAAQQEAG